MADYIDDATEVEPIANYEETDADRQQFYDDLWEHDDKPTTLPDGFDFSEDDPEDFERVVDEERAADIADDWFKFAYGYAEHGNGVGRANVAHAEGETIVFKLPGWFGQKELGQYGEWWFGSFQVAKQDDDGEYTAMCVADIERMEDRSEDSYFRNPIEEEWIPMSLVDFAFTVQEEQTDDHLIFDGAVRGRGTKQEADIVAVDLDTNARHGPKIVLDSPYEAKDDIKALDWEACHRDWDGNHWTIDADALWDVIQELTAEGWTFCVPEGLERMCVDEEEDASACRPYLPVEEVTA